MPPIYQSRVTQPPLYPPTFLIINTFICFAIKKRH